MKTALAYNRKSRGDIEDLSKNKKELLDYCKLNNFEVQYFEEIGSSVDSSRIEYVKLINEIRTGKYEVLVVVDLSRLTRDLEQQIKLFKLLTKYGMKIHSLLDGKIDPESSTNKMISTIKGLFNESVYEETSRKMALGRVQSARSGKWMTVPPFGYRKNPETLRLELDEDESPIVRRIFEQVIHGYSTTEISLRLYKDGFRSRKGNKLHPSTISNLLERRTYIGETIYKSLEFNEEVRLKDTHQGIVTLEEFMTVREILSKKQKFRTRTRKITSPLDKLIVCGKCNRLMQINFAGKNRKYIHLQKCAAFSGELCQNRGCSINHLMPTIYKEVKKRIPIIQKKIDLMYQGKNNQNLENMSLELKSIEKQIKAKEKEKTRLLDFLLNGTISELIYSNKNKELEEEIENLQLRSEDITEAVASNNIENDIEYKKKLLADLIQLEKLEVEEQNRILKKTIEKIVYVREDQDIDMKVYFK